MTATHPAHVRRPVMTGAAWRAALAVVAAVAVVAEAPVWVRLPLSVAALVGTATFFSRRYGRRGVLDTVLVVAGAAIVAAILLGFLLNLTPFGITTQSWGVTIGAVELVVLAFLALFRAPVSAGSAAAGSASPRARRRVRPAAVAWGGAALVVLAVAVGVSAASFTASHVAPLALSVVPAGASTEISVTAGTQAGPFSVVLRSGATRSVLATGVRVGPDSTWRETIVSPTRRSRLELVPADAAKAVRTLELDPAATGSAAG